MNFYIDNSYETLKDIFSFHNNYLFVLSDGSAGHNKNEWL